MKDIFWAILVLAILGVIGYEYIHLLKQFHS